MSSKKKSSSDEKKSTKQIKKYYKEKESSAKKEAKTESQRLQEDLDRVLNEVGIAKTRAIEDYQRNIANIEANKSADISDLNYYVTTQKGRTQEDLNTSLAKETRRYTLEQDKVNQDLADAGLTFSERTPEKIAAAGNALNVQDINTVAERSFQDIARYEATKNRDIELKYGQQTESAETTKSRTLEDLINEQVKAQQSYSRNYEDTQTKLSDTLRDISYGQDTDVALTKQQFAKDKQDKIDRENRIAVLGY
jgi:hypothetical protein